MTLSYRGLVRQWEVKRAGTITIEQHEGDRSMFYNVCLDLMDVDGTNIKQSFDFSHYDEAVQYVHDHS